MAYSAFYSTAVAHLVDGSWSKVFIASVMFCAAVNLAGAAQSSAGHQIKMADILGASSDGYEKAEPGYTLRFPEDHGEHPDFRHEWWYFTGHLDDTRGRRYGFQFTLFRFALSATDVPGPSAWSSRQAYMAHVALTDEAGGRFFSAERLSRGALDLAGVRTAPLALWLEDWRLDGLSEDGEPPWQLFINDSRFQLNLELGNAKPMVLQGQQGYSRKGEGAASYYYSYTRLATKGVLEINGERIAVKGESWFDHEWGSAGLSKTQQGWDWFALQLDNGEEFMWYQMRTNEGSMDPASSGVWVSADGASHLIKPMDIQLRPNNYWQSPDGRCYPVGWTLRMSEKGEWKLQALLKNQWMDHQIRYWEGAMIADGEVSGRAYVELTGYPFQAVCP